jgi:hypothetical protein
MNTKTHQATHTPDFRISVSQAEGCRTKKTWVNISDENGLIAGARSHNVVAAARVVARMLGDNPAALRALRKWGEECGIAIARAQGGEL